MRNTFTRSTPAVALAIGAIAIAGCGGSGNSSTAAGKSASSAKSWGQQMQALGTQLTAAFQPIKVKSSRENPQTWFTLATKLNQIHTQAAALKPPAVAVSLNSAIVAGLAPLSGEATTIGNDLKSGNKTQAKADAQTLERSLLALVSKIATAVAQLSGQATGQTST